MFQFCLFSVGHCQCCDEAVAIKMQFYQQVAKLTPLVFAPTLLSVVHTGLELQDATNPLASAFKVARRHWPVQLRLTVLLLNAILSNFLLGSCQSRQSQFCPAMLRYSLLNTSATIRTVFAPTQPNPIFFPSSRHALGADSRASSNTHP